MLCLPLPRRSRLLAMCLMVAKLAGAWALRMRHSSSRNTMSITQCSPFSTPQWLRTAWPILLGVARQRADVVAGLLFDLARDQQFTPALYLRYAAHARPLVVLLQPRKIIGRNHTARLQASVALLETLMQGDRVPRKTILPFVEQQRHILMQRPPDFLSGQIHSPLSGR